MRPDFNTEGMGLSCSLAFNGSAHFALRYHFLQNCSALSSLTLEPKNKASLYWGSNPLPIIKTDKTKVYPFLYRGDGIRTHGGIAPTQPFQDCTLNLSDTPLSVYKGFSFLCSFCAQRCPCFRPT